MVMANKAAAHFTLEMPHDNREKHLYKPANRPCRSLTSLGFTNLASNANEPL